MLTFISTQIKKNVNVRSISNSIVVDIILYLQKRATKSFSLEKCGTGCCS